MELSVEDRRQLWVNFAHPLNDVVQVIDTESMQVVDTLEPGKHIRVIQRFFVEAN